MRYIIVDSCVTCPLSDFSEDENGDSIVHCGAWNYKEENPRIGKLEDLLQIPTPHVLPEECPLLNTKDMMDEVRAYYRSIAGDRGFCRACGLNMYHDEGTVCNYCKDTRKYND